MTQGFDKNFPETMAGIISSDFRNQFAAIQTNNAGDVAPGTGGVNPEFDPEEGWFWWKRDTRELYAYNKTTESFIKIADEDSGNIATIASDLENTIDNLDLLWQTAGDGSLEPNAGQDITAPGRVQYGLGGYLTNGIIFGNDDAAIENPDGQRINLRLINNNKKIEYNINGLLTGTGAVLNFQEPTTGPSVSPTHTTGFSSSGMGAKNFTTLSFYVPKASMASVTKRVIDVDEFSFVRREVDSGVDFTQRFYTVESSTLTGASVIVPTTLASGAYIKRIWYLVTETITGPTSFDITIPGPETIFINQTGLSPGSATNKPLNKILDTTNTPFNITIVANGGNFTAGKIKIMTLVEEATDMTA